MRRSLLLLGISSAVACALAAPAVSARHIKLEGGGHTGAVRFLTSLHVNLEEGKRTSWVTITRTGDFTDPRYGKFSITKPMLLSMVANFEKRAYGQDIFIDVSHRPSDGAAGKVTKLTVEGDRLRALVEWTDFGIEAIQKRGFVYLSAEYHENFKDNEKGELHGPVLLGAGLTVRPVIKGLDPVLLSEDTDNVPRLLHPELQAQLLQEIQMKWTELIKALSEKLKAFKLADAIIAQLITLAEGAVGKTTDEAVAKALIASFETAGKNLSEEIAKGATGDVKISLALPDSFKTGMSEADVKKLMETMQADAATAAKKLAESKDAKLKILSDTIKAAQGIDDEMKKELTEAVQDLVTAEMTDEQVTKLAAVQIASGNRLVASRTLAGQGYTIAGSPHISVDSSNEIKALQEEVDKRLGYEKMAGHQRYKLSEGVKVEGNKELVDKALAMYDAQNARRLHEEYRRMKKLAAGDSLVSDVAVPASFERTVIREALYQLVGLGLCDVGTGQFAAVLQLPYSYRDTAAAGVTNVRKYEGQAIARAGVKQAMEEARPIPQKIAFEVSDELRYLAGNGQIDFDIVAENARNATRIIGEDTERLLFDEHLNAADQYAVTAVVGEAVAVADGVKKTFVLDQFPVVRPKKIYDLQGSQVGSTLYPIAVRLGGVAKLEYDGSNTQPADTYWTINYNLGEITFVNQLGVAVAPANTTAVAADYSYTTNVYKFDTDLGALAVDAKYDDFLYRFGLRKALIEDRSYMPNVGIMSGTVRTQIEQARQFGANFKRSGTDLMADGNLGRIKDIPGFRSYAPGLAIGDQRVVLCERASTRYRMLKPWTMNQLENQKDANGRFTGKKEAFGDQFVVVHTPTQLKGAFTSMVLYGAAARIDR